MTILTIKPTIGDLNRRFERDRTFMHGTYAAGPAVTPAGSANADLSLRYGTYEGLKRPAEIKIWRFKIVIGDNATEWVRLSTMEMRLVFMATANIAVVLQGS